MGGGKGRWRESVGLDMAKWSSWMMAVVACVAGALAARGATVAAAANADELAARVLPVFRTKCGSCHGSEAAKPKKFSCVDDLPKLASNGKLVTPGDADHSGLWESIADGDMPPDDAKTGPLSDEEKKAIRAWIDGGAPPTVGGNGGGGGGAVISSAGMITTTPAAVVPPSLGRRALKFFGKFHPLVAHFPIALLMTAAMAEGLWIFTRGRWLTGAVRVCVGIGSLGAIAAGVMGWVNSYFHTSSSLLTQHRWLGTTAMLWTLPLLWLCEIGFRRSPANDPASTADWAGRSRVRFEVVLFVGVALVGAAAHLGGALVYGEDYFKF